MAKKAKAVSTDLNALLDEAGYSSPEAAVKGVAATDGAIPTRLVTRLLGLTVSSGAATSASLDIQYPIATIPVNWMVASGIAVGLEEDAAVLGVVYNSTGQLVAVHNKRLSGAPVWRLLFRNLPLRDKEPARLVVFAEGNPAVLADERFIYRPPTVASAIAALAVTTTVLSILNPLEDGETVPHDSFTPWGDKQPTETVTAQMCPTDGGACVNATSVLYPDPDELTWSAVFPALDTTKTYDLIVTGSASGEVKRQALIVV